MAKRLIRTWLDSLEHQFGRRKCEALACNFLNQALMDSLPVLGPEDVAGMMQVISVYDKHYHDQTILASELEWVRRFERLSYHNFGSSETTNIYLAAHYVARIITGTENADGIPSWQKSLEYSIEALEADFMKVMTNIQFILEHLD